MPKIPWGWMILILMAIGSWKYFTEPPKNLALEDPVQTYIIQRTVYQHGNYYLDALANYTVEARVLSKKLYDNDQGAELAPIDLALGWGDMSRSSVLDKLSISQSNRFFFYRWEGEPPIPSSEITSHSANTHLIPTSAEIEKQLKDVRVGQVVKLTGQLVEARTSNGFHWRSSLTRDDSGDGACELMRVESISVR